MRAGNNISSFIDAYLDYLDGNRGEPPAPEGLPISQRARAESFIASITAARGIDPYATRPSIEELIARRPPEARRFA